MSYQLPISPNVITHLANTTELRALEAGAFPVVVRDGFAAAGDGGATFFVWNSGSSATDNGGSVIAPNSGAGRWIADFSVIPMNVKQFGAAGNGSTADDTAFVNAFAALESGMVLHVPASSGAYVLASSIPLSNSNSNIQIVGDGTAVTSILKTSTTNDMFDLSGSNNITIQGLNVYTNNSASSVTGGTIFNFSGSNGGKFIVHDCQIDGLYRGIDFIGNANSAIFVDRCLIYNMIDRGVKVTNGNSVHLTNLDIFGPGSGAAYENSIGVELNQGDGFFLENINVTGYGNTGIRFYQSISGSTNQYLANIKCLNVFADTIFNGNAWEIDGGNGEPNVPIYAVDISNCWGATTSGYGAHIVWVSGITFDDFRSLNNGAHGLYVDSNVFSLNITGGQYYGNSQSTADTYDGIHILTDITDFTITGVRAGDVPLPFSIPNQQRYSIYIEAGSSNDYSIVGNNLIGCVTGALFDGGTGTNRVVKGNVGVDDNIPNVTAAATITLPDNPVITITGTTTVTTINGGWAGRIVTIIPLSNTPFSAGSGNISNSITASAPIPIMLVYGGTDWCIK